MGVKRFLEVRIVTELNSENFMENLDIFLTDLRIFLVEFCVDGRLRTFNIPSEKSVTALFLYVQAVPVEKSYAPEDPHKERKTLLRAAFVNKKHRVQYEMRTFYHFLTLKVGWQEHPDNWIFPVFFSTWLVALPTPISNMFNEISQKASLWKLLDMRWFSNWFRQGGQGVR